VRLSALAFWGGLATIAGYYGGVPAGAAVAVVAGAVTMWVEYARPAEVGDGPSH
jgi:hypothetical protein